MKQGRIKSMLKRILGEVDINGGEVTEAERMRKLSGKNVTLLTIYDWDRKRAYCAGFTGHSPEVFKGDGIDATINFNIVVANGKFGENNLPYYHCSVKKVEPAVHQVTERF